MKPCLPEPFGSDNERLGVEVYGSKICYGIARL